MATTLDVDVVPCISARCFVVRRVAHPAVFVVELPQHPSWFGALFADVQLPVRMRVTLGAFDWARKSFAAVEAT